MTREEVRALALALPHAEEAGHHGIPSFRVAGKIFCTVHLEHPRAMVKLAPDDQHNLAEAHPDVIQPVPGFWGRKGSTFVALDAVDPALMRMLLDLAWRNVAPKRLAKTLS